ncbi:hypothetical protein Tco_0661474 [Tanacetum coccineum]
MKNRVSTLSKDDLGDLVKAFRIPLNLHPRFPDPTLTLDRLPHDVIGVYSESLWFFSVRIPFSTFLLSVLGYFKRHSHSYMSNDLLVDGYNRDDVERLCAGLICLREMREEVLVCSGLSFVWSNQKCDPVFRRKDDNSGRFGGIIFSAFICYPLYHTTAPAAKGALIPLPTPDEATTSQPDPRLARRSQVPEVGSSNLEVEQTKGLGDADISRFCVELEDSLERSGNIHVRVVSAPLPHLGSATSGFIGKPGFEDVRHCSAPLDTLAHNTLSRDAEYDQILKDDFATTSGGEEIDLTFFPLVHGPYVIPYPFDDPDVCRKALDRTITPAELRRKESLLPLELMNRVNVLSAMFFSHGTELNNRYSSVVARRSRTQEKLHCKSKELHSQNNSSSEEVKRLQSQLANATDFTAGLSDELAWTDVILADYALVVRDLQNELALERRLLLSVEFYAALAHVASLGVASSVERGLRMGRTDAEFEAAVHNVSNFSIHAMTDLNKALDAFPSTQFPFLAKVASASEGPLSKVTQILPDKFIRSAEPVSSVPSVVSETPNQASPGHAPHGSPSVAYFNFYVIRDKGSLYGSSLSDVAIYRRAYLLGGEDFVLPPSPCWLVPSPHLLEDDKRMWRQVLFLVFYPAWSFWESSDNVLSPLSKGPGRCDVDHVIFWAMHRSSGPRIPFSMYSFIGVIQVLTASSTIVFTLAMSIERSLSSSINTPFVSPLHCTAASLVRASAFLFSSLGM